MRSRLGRVLRGPYWEAELTRDHQSTDLSFRDGLLVVGQVLAGGTAATITAAALAGTFFAAITITWLLGTPHQLGLVIAFGIVLPALLILEGARRIAHRATPVAVGVGVGAVTAAVALVFLAILVSQLSDGIS